MPVYMTDPPRVTIKFDGQEYRVPAVDKSEAGAYYTDDRQDALDTAALIHPGHEFKIRRVLELVKS